MAKAKTTPPAPADGADAPPRTATPATPATPENTPVPGGGRWRWSVDHWAEVIEPTEAQSTNPSELE